MSASEMEDLLDEIGSRLGCTPYLDGGAIDRAEAALSKLRAVLSGSSAPQAAAAATPDEKALRAYRAGHPKCTKVNNRDTRCPLCKAAAAALSMKSEGSDPDSSQKGEP